MNATEKGTLINGIIIILNQQVEAKNKKLVSENLFSDQEPLHGARTVFDLAFMADEDLQQIAAACGL